MFHTVILCVSIGTYFFHKDLVIYDITVILYNPVHFVARKKLELLKKLLLFNSFWVQLNTSLLGNATTSDRGKRVTAYYK